jgi:hypothetical protein
MTEDELVTHDEVARWLPTDVRERIEVTKPCVDGGEHDWRHDCVEIQSWGRGVVATIESWACQVPGCWVVARTEPELSQDAPS